MIYFSASDLVKRSAKQIKFLRNKERPEPTENILNGEKFQQELSDNNKGSAPELKTTFSYKDVSICACHDLLFEDKLFEIKSVNGTPEDWYLQNSLIQCVFYKSLVMKSDGTLVTPEFRIKQGFDKITMIVDPNIPYFLHFGDTEYRIEVNDPEQIINYFFRKALVTLKSYEECTKYDLVHNHKHFQDLEGLFTFSQVLEPEMLLKM